MKRRGPPGAAFLVVTLMILYAGASALALAAL